MSNHVRAHSLLKIDFVLIQKKNMSFAVDVTEIKYEFSLYIIVRNTNLILESKVIEHYIGLFRDL
jgi:hypothetical protein